MERVQRAGRDGPEARLPATVVGLGVVSLLTDASSEAIFPLLPAFLAGLGASTAFDAAWDRFGNAPAFVASGALALVAAGALLALVPAEPAAATVPGR